MNKASAWGGVIGGIIAAASLVGAANELSNPTDMPAVNVARIALGIGWLVFGIALVVLYFRSRHKEEAGKEQEPVEPGSEDDTRRLVRRRDLIFAFFLTILSTGGFDSWILNDYRAGFTWINVSVIYGIVVGLIYIYITIELFRGKRNIVPFLFYVVIVDAICSIALVSWRKEWYDAAFQLMPLIYFVFAIKAPTTRRNFRIAHFIFLPLLVVAACVLNYFGGNKEIATLSKAEAASEQTFMTATSDLGGTYDLLLNKDTPTIHEIQAVNDAEAQRDAALQDVVLKIDAIQAAYMRQIPTVSQQMSMEQWRHTLAILDIDQQQGNKVKEFMAYLQSVDLKHISNAQAAKVADYIRQVRSYNDQLTALQNTFNYR